MGWGGGGGGGGGGVEGGGVPANLISISFALQNHCLLPPLLLVVAYRSLISIGKPI